MRKFISWLLYEDFLWALLVILSVVVFVLAISKGMYKSEEVECLKWKHEAIQLKGFYFTQWQADQCRAHGFFTSEDLIK